MRDHTCPSSKAFKVHKTKKVLHVHSKIHSQGSALTAISTPSPVKQRTRENTPDSSIERNPSLDLPTYKDVLSAATRLSGVANETPVMKSRTLNERLGAQVFFKCENYQRMGAFKFRGAYNALSQLSDDQKKKGVVTYSFGNHSQAIALSAKLLGIKATIFMPSDASKAKIAGTKGYGGNVIFYDRHKVEGQVLVAELAQKSGMTIIPPYNHKDVIAGQGTVAKELIEEVGELDYLFVCVGGGGLIAGMSLAVKELSPNCKIYGVEPLAGNDAQQSFYKGEIVQIPGPRSIADGALTTALGDLTFALIRQNVEDMLTVTDP